MTTDIRLAAFLNQVLTAKESIPGRKAFQKLLYLAQALGYPSDYSFRLHLFGPYSEEAADELDILEEGGAVLESAAGAICKADYLGALAGTFPMPDDAKTAIDNTVAHFGHETPLQLELLATALFMWQADKRVQRHATDEGVGQRVQRYKGDKYTPEQIQQAIARLKELGLAN